MRNPPDYLTTVDARGLTPVAAASVAKQLGRPGDAAALALFRSLQWGREAERMVEVRRPYDAPEHVAELGRLVDIELADGQVVHGNGDIILAVASTRPFRDLWLLAVDGVKLAKAPKGAIAAITYATRKGRRKLALYRHAFRRPDLPTLGSDITGHARIYRGRSRYHVTERGIVG